MKSITSTLAAAGLAITLGGCAAWDDLSTTQKGTAAGAGVGGAVGAAVSNGSVLGTVGGAAIGGAVGHEIGKRKEND